MQISSIGSEMDSRQDDFLISTPNKYPDLIDDAGRDQAAASSANRRNDAKRAVRIAPVLNFHNRTRAPARSRMRFRHQLVFKENVAAKDFRVAGRARLKFGLHHFQRE